MLHNRARLVLLLAALGTTALATFACGGGSSTEGPQKQIEVVSPSGLKVNATIAAVSLGESYSGSNVQLAFVANDAAVAASVEVTSVVLVDMTTGEAADVLKASSPSVWNGSSYVAWNQKVTPGGDLRASYQLTTPNWAAIDGTGKSAPATGARSSSRSYSNPFRLRVTMRIDGTEVILESSELHREPVAVT